MNILGKMTGGGDGSDIPAIDVATVNDQLRKQEVTLVDVRTEDEWRDGIAIGAHTISLGDPALSEKVLSLVQNDNQKPVALICRSGMRSMQAASILQRAGFTSLANVTGGMMAWTAQGLPTQDWQG